MCILCNQGRPQHPYFSRRNFLKGATAIGAASLFAPRPARAHDDDGPPRDSGRPGRRYLIRAAPSCRWTRRSRTCRAATCWSKANDPAIGPSLSAGGADVIDARGKIVMPGFIDTHHHQAWTAIRSSIPDSILINDGTNTPGANQNYYLNVLGGGQPAPAGFARHYGRRTCTSANCSVGCRSSTMVSPPSTTFRRSITRRSTPMLPSRRCSTQVAVRPLATSRAQALFRATNTRRTRSASSNAGSRPAISSST